MKTVSTTVLRENLSDAINSLSNDERYMLISKQGKAVSALVDLDYFEDLLARSSSEYLISVREARADHKAGRTSSHEDVFGTL